MSNKQVFNSGKAVGKTEVKVDHLADTATSALSNATEATKQKGSEAKSAVSHAKDAVKSKAGEAMDKVKSSCKK